MDYSTRSKSDLIIVDGLSVHAALGASHWPRPGVEHKLQPLVLSITVPQNLAQAGAGDNLEESVSYGSICKVAEACAHEKGKFSSVEALAAGIASSCFSTFSSVHEVRSVIEKQRALLHAQGAGVQSVHRRTGGPINDTYFVRDLELSTIIGMHPWERVEKQLVRINLQWTLAPSSIALPATGFDFRSLVARISDLTTTSSYQTVESLATSIAQTSLEAGQNIDEITVRVGKPSALMMANTAAVQITRSWKDFPELARGSLSRALAFDPPAEGHVAILALGSNMGDRFGHIETALKMLESECVKVLDTSFLYETKAMYHEDQDSFVNGACATHTSLSPTDLLALLKRVEEQVGRTPTFRNGPRVVDLDIIFYDDLTVDIANGDLPLQIPHVRLREREFVLRPLADIVPTYTHPALKIPIQTLLTPLPKQPTPMRRVMPLFPTHPPSSSPRPYWTWGTQTLLMATLNTTPDSFSDGGDHNQLSPALSYAHRSLASGAHVIDVGGYSTRPHAKAVGVEEEIERIVPVIKVLREKGVVVSVDTFRGSVAREAILAGASWVNDVRAGRGEYLSSSLPRDRPTTFDVSREFGCPIVLMHSREAAHEDKEYPEGVLQGVRRELGACVEEALQAGVRRWNIIVDPGYGFSKTVEGNVELVRNLGDLISTAGVLKNLPILAGTSRKSYLGAVVGGKAGEEAKARDWATAAAVGACVQAGADIVRVHNVEAMKDVVSVADRIWRGGE
ncbi:trifunctional dihydropteroate synthetase [Ceratobasidium sp. 394]|nr:trifunctional dihydropteroate synthetase [Ceratobasidium sp. 394]